MGGPSYTPIPGSDRLRTKKRGASPADAVLAADRASVARVDVDVAGAVVSVGRVVVAGPSVPLLLDVVDRLLPLLEAEEAAVFVHLYRLALENERDACRVSRAELSRRTRLTDRRLGRAIAGLVDKGAVVLIDRDRDGTLYRLVFPDEGPAAATSKKTAPPKTTPTKKPAADAPAVAAIEAAPLRSVGDVCAWFAARFGVSTGRSGADVASVVLELLEEGVTFARMPALLEAFVKTAPKTTPLRDWASFVTPSPSA